MNAPAPIATPAETWSPPSLRETNKAVLLDRPQPGRPGMYEHIARVWAALRVRHLPCSASCNCDAGAHVAHELVITRRPDVLPDWRVRMGERSFHVYGTGIVPSEHRAEWMRLLTVEEETAP